MNKKGFTLVELLVVIVILGLIMIVVATTAFPAMNKAKLNSLETYTLRLVEKAKERCISDSCTDGTEYTVEELMGENAEKGYKESIVITESKKEYKTSGNIVSSDNKYIAVVKNDIVAAKLYSDVFKAYMLGDPVYYNPVDNIKCTEKEATANKNSSGFYTGVKTGCMKWYVIETDDNDEKKHVDIILDHNTTAAIAWGANGNTYQNSSIKIEVDKLDDPTSSGGSGWVSGLNPRLIKSDEIAHIVGADREDTIKWSSTKTNGTSINSQSAWFYLDGGKNPNKTSYSSSDGWQKQYASYSKKSEFHWLYDRLSSCTTYGCKVTDTASSYWTDTPVKGFTHLVWTIGNNGYMGTNSVTKSDNCGIRPVITISKIVIS